MKYYVLSIRLHDFDPWSFVQSSRPTSIYNKKKLVFDYKKVKTFTSYSQMKSNMHLYFKVYVNGKKCMKFAARGSVEDIKGVNIKGEAYVYEVKLERKLVSRQFYKTLVKHDIKFQNKIHLRN